MKTFKIKHLIGMTLLLFLMNCSGVFAVSIDAKANLVSEIIKAETGLEDLVSEADDYLALVGPACTEKKRRIRRRCVTNNPDMTKAECQRRASRKLRRRNARAAANGDADDDCLTGARDNCLGVPNGDQTDTDNDGVGDACEEEDKTLDLIVSGGYDEDEIYIFRDILNGDSLTLEADVEIVSDSPRGLAFVDNTLYVGADDTIEVYENIDTIADGAMPDKTFGPDTGINPDDPMMGDHDCDISDYIHGVRMYMGDLYVVDTSNSCLAIWRDVASKDSGAAADVAIDLTKEEINIDDARGFWVGENQVVVGNYDDADSDEAQLVVFRDAMNIGNDTMPDIIIQGGVGNLRGSSGIEVHNNRLFVGGYYSDGQDYIYNNFSGLTSSSAPDVILDDHPTTPADLENEVAFANSYDFQFIGDAFISVARFPESGNFSPPTRTGGFECDTVRVWNSVPTQNFQLPDKVLCPDDGGSVVSATYGNRLYIAHEDSGFVTAYDDALAAPNNATPDRIFFDERMTSAHHMTLAERATN